MKDSKGEQNSSLRARSQQSRLLHVSCFPSSQPRISIFTTAPPENPDENRQKRVLRELFGERSLNFESKPDAENSLLKWKMKEANKKCFAFARLFFAFHHELEFQNKIRKQLERESNSATQSLRVATRCQLPRSSDDESESQMQAPKSRP